MKLATNTLSRRSILRGLGAGSVMLSGMWRSAQAAGAGQPTRAAMFFHGNGAHPDWAPMGSGTNFTLTPHLMGLEPVKSDLIIFRRLMAQRDMSLNPHKGATLDLSTAGGADSLDQVLAKHVKATQPTPSRRWSWPSGAPTAAAAWPPRWPWWDGSSCPASGIPCSCTSASPGPWLRATR
jgi:hypothetical protein